MPLAASTGGPNELKSHPRVQSVFNLDGMTAVYVYGALAFVWITFTFLVYWDLHDTVIDDYSFYIAAGVYG